MTLILASASPRRRELLGLIVDTFECRPTHIDESVHANESPEDYVVRVANAKALACNVSASCVLAADTTVTVDGAILGKPSSHDDARAMLEALSGRAHHVLTAIAMRDESRLESRLVATTVEFAPLSGSLIASYLDTEEPWDKAGAYGIQGFAGCFVRSISGSYSAVVGLPLCETRELLADFALPLRASGKALG